FECPVEPLQGKLCHPLLHETVTEEVGTVKEAARLVVLAYLIDSVLKFLYSFLHQAHFLISDSHLVVRFVITIIDRRIDFLDAEFETDLVKIKCLAGSYDRRILEDRRLRWFRSRSDLGLRTVVQDLDLRLAKFVS